MFPEVFAEKNPRRIILDALADNHFTATRYQIEHPPYRIARRLVRAFLFRFPHHCEAFNAAASVRAPGQTQ